MSQISKVSTWQKAWLDRFSCELPSTVPYPRKPLTVLLDFAAERFPEHPACTLYGESMTYREIYDKAHRLARALKNRGAGPGKRVGLLLPNIPEYLISLQAIWMTGASALQLSPLMVADELTHWIETTGCETVIALDLLTPNLHPALEQGRLENIIVTSLVERLALWKGLIYRIVRYRRGGSFRLREDDHHTWFESMVDVEPMDKPVEIDPINDVAVVAPTGGTTASPKAVMLTHHNLLANAMQLRNWCGGQDGEQGVLGVLPLFHSYGLAVSVLTTWAMGATVHLYPRFETKAVLNVILEHQPAIVPAVPAMINALNGLLRKKPKDLSFIRQVISGAAALDPSVRAEFESFGVQELIEGYGLTEASPVTHANLPGDNNRPGTIGVPMVDTEAKIVDSATGSEELPDGAVGELIVRGPQIMKGYFNNPLATSSALRDGWLYTGDMAKRDEDGYFTIVDRKKDIIKTSGYLVFPAEVEEVLMTFPSVAEAAVIGQPDVDKGEIVKAMIVPHDIDQFDLSALKRFCEEHLGKQKRPREYEIVTELPRNFLGKVLRRHLREEVKTPHATTND